MDSGACARNAFVRLKAGNIRDLDRGCGAAPAAIERELNGLSDSDLLDPIVEINQPAHWSIVRGDDDIAQLSGHEIDAAHSRSLGRRLRQRAHDDDPFHAEPGSERFIRRDDPNPRDRHPSVQDQLWNDPVHHVDGDGEANSCIGARRRVDRGVDADQAASRVQQQTS